MAQTKSFFWYELMTGDIQAAEAFYGTVVGWRGEKWQGEGTPPYIVMKAGERGVGGIMPMPEHYRQGGGHPAWVGYIYTDDVDGQTDAVRNAGGAVHRPPGDIPGVGRFAVVADPQGAIFQLLKPTGSDQPPAPAGTPGHVGWHELYTSDWEEALAFYSSQFGWQKTREYDMGAMGIYALFSMGGDEAGGMMNKPQQIPNPVWQFYFTVPGIDAAAKRVADNGGKVLMGPMEVPGGSWVAQCQDPQGAHFALVAQAR
jgi:predicted enzyme related to lactoylglutathione lyase